MLGGWGLLFGVSIVRPFWEDGLHVYVFSEGQSTIRTTANIMKINKDNHDTLTYPVFCSQILLLLRFFWCFVCTCIVIILNAHIAHRSFFTQQTAAKKIWNILQSYVVRFATLWWFGKKWPKRIFLHFLPNGDQSHGRSTIHLIKIQALSLECVKTMLTIWARV